MKVESVPIEWHLSVRHMPSTNGGIDQVYGLMTRRGSVGDDVRAADDGGEDAR